MPTPENLSYVEKQSYTVRQSKEFIKSHQLVLPDNEDLKNKLERKLLEYKSRVSEIRKNSPQSAPEIIEETNRNNEIMKIDSYYKIAVLEELLSNGKVDTKELFEKLKTKDGEIDSMYFDNACSVIDRYTRDEKVLHPGTGLK